MDSVALSVGDDLDFDMAWAGKIFLDIDRVVAEGGPGFGPRHLEGIGDPRCVFNDLHAATTAACCRLHDHGITDLARDLLRFLNRLDRAVRSGHHRDARGLHRIFGCYLVTHRRDGIRRGADEGQAVFLDDSGEARILRQESVARMDRVCARHRRGRYDGRHVEVAILCGRRADAHALVRQAHMHGV